MRLPDGHCPFSPHAEFGPNDHWKDAAHFTFPWPKISGHGFLIFVPEISRQYLAESFTDILLTIFRIEKIRLLNFIEKIDSDAIK